LTPSAGGKPDKIWRDALMRAVKREIANGPGRKLEMLADKLVDKALEGDVSALKEIGDRIDGKPAQAITGEADAPIELIMRWANEGEGAGGPE